MSKLKNHPALMRRLELALVNLCLIEFLIHVENEKLSSKKGKSLMSHTKANLQCGVQLSKCPLKQSFLFLLLSLCISNI